MRLQRVDGACAGENKKEFVPKQTNNVETESLGLSVRDQLRFAMSIMDYNQSFVIFVDGKANSLLLINSIFLASLAAVPMSAALSVIAALTACASILLCLLVVWARMPGELRADRSGLVFFGHILKRRNVGTYLAEFRTAITPEIVESLLKQVYALAQIVSQKLKVYQMAQLLTFGTAVLWVIQLASPVLRSLSA